MKLAIIKERKSPPDRRVVFSPKACQKLLKTYKDLSICIEPSQIRAYTDGQYAKAGLKLQSDVSDCDVLLGVKEVPIEALIPNKSYFFFSHTIKKQAYNRNLLRAVLDKNITLYDHEVITSEKGTRLVAFGRYAGIVGAYNAVRTYGLKSQTFDIPKASELHDKQALIDTLKKIKLPAIKILLTGKGRVGNGAFEILNGMGLKQVDTQTFLTQNFDCAVFAQIDVEDYNKFKEDKIFNQDAFFKNPTDFKSNFMRFAKVTDVYIAGHFYADGAPYIFTREDAKQPDFNISVVADISCDIDGPVASTIRSTTIADPIYGYDPQTEQEVGFLNPKAIAVMAVDNLPCELPIDASDGFGEMFAKHVMPAFFNHDADGVLERARMTKNGKLTSKYNYLQDFLTANQ
ncbi:MAG: NAD(P)-dependent oxidoreductase [Flavobacteriaceae bacterium]|nr:NAD(P)-dependent oxidoreductase [Flavobacteriaceae bacterium]